jgi:hypothetical protein
VGKDGETVIMDGHCSVFAQTTLSAQLAGASKHVLLAAVGDRRMGECNRDIPLPDNFHRL